MILTKAGAMSRYRQQQPTSPMMPHRRPNCQDVIITHATLEDIPSIVDFTKTARASMFPMLDAASHNKLAEKELAGSFRRSFLDHPDGAFLVGRINGLLVATIGYVSYDHRFPQFQLGPERVVEVIRLYVHPTLRRAGVASQLFAALEAAAREVGIQRLYLHTHPFLPGAVSFWERHGFQTIFRDDDDLVWRTIHMDLPLSER